MVVFQAALEYSHPVTPIMYYSNFAIIQFMSKESKLDVRS